MLNLEQCVEVIELLQGVLGNLEAVTSKDRFFRVIQHLSLDVLSKCIV